MRAGEKGPQPEHRKLKEKKHKSPMTLVPTSLIHICRWRLNFKQVRKEKSAAGTYMNARLTMALERKWHKGHSKVWCSVNIWRPLTEPVGRECVVLSKVFTHVSADFGALLTVILTYYFKMWLLTGNFKSKVNWLKYNTYNAMWGRREMRVGFWWERLKKGDFLDELVYAGFQA
jgi:hypothetical protein